MRVLFGRERKRFSSLGHSRYYCRLANPEVFAGSDEISNLHVALHDLDQNKPLLLDSSSWTRLLHTCGKLKALAEGKRFHQHISRLDLDRGSLLGLPLLTMYCKLDCIEDARLVFDRLTEKSVISWTVMIGAYAHKGLSKLALNLLKRMQLEGTRPSGITFVSALTACRSPAELPEGVLIHSCIDESCVEESKVAVGNTLISMYGKCGSLEDAKKTFFGMDLRDAVSWNIVIAACSRYEDCEDQVLKLFQEMQLEGFSPQNLTLGIVLHACSRLEALEQGKLIHQSLVNSGIKLNYAVGIALINLYGRCGSLEDACDAFQGMEDRSCVVSWNSMMTVFIQRGCFKRAVSLFYDLHQQGLRPTKVTYITILNACSNRSFLSAGKLIHGSVAESGHEQDVAVGNALINMYDACGSLRDAEVVFFRMSDRNSISWNVIIAAYIQHSQVDKAKNLFRSMMQQLGKPDRATLVLLLNCCTSLAEVERFHSYIFQRGDESHGILGSALVNMHGRYGTLEEARRIFQSLQYRDIISWNGMIGACANTGNCLEAWEIYRRMNEDGGISPNTVTYVAVLDACTRIVALDKGREVHASIPEKQLKSTVEIGISLVNFYGKCGKVVEARQVFEGMMTRDVVLWSSMIAAFAQLGHWEESLLLVKEMQQEGTEPNHVTYVSVFAACSHAGLVEEAYDHFLEMTSYDLSPTCEHYRCIVDLLARAGQLDEAEKVLTKVENIGPLAWMTLLAACKSQGDVERARRAAKLAIKFNPDSSAGYVALFNTFAGREEQCSSGNDAVDEI